MATMSTDKAVAGLDRSGDQDLSPGEAPAEPSQLRLGLERFGRHYRRIGVCYGAIRTRHGVVLSSVFAAAVPACSSSRM
jgi:hypothetical protein